MSLKRKLGILVVDDDKEYCELIKQILTEREYDVESVNDGNKGLDCIQHNHFDLMLTDIEMPGIRGVQLVCKALKINPDLKIIVSTGYPSDSDAMNLINKGITSYMIKPVKTVNLISIVQSALRESQKSYSPYDEESTVLVADSNTQLVRSYNTLLKSCGYKVITACRSDKIFDSLRKNKIGVVVLEKRLGYEDGKHIARRIGDIYPYVKIIINTDVGDTHDISLLYPHVIFDYIRKTNGPGVLPEKVKHAFDFRFKQINKFLSEHRHANLWGIAGPSGSGKTTLTDLMTIVLPYTYKFVRHVSRPARPSEIQGDDHFFVKKSYFEKYNKKFFYTFEQQNIKGLPYKVGFEKGIIEEKLSQGRDVFLILKNPGSLHAVSELYPDMKLALLLSQPEQSMHRTNARGGGRHSAISLNGAFHEFEQFYSHINEADVYVINDNPLYKEEYNHRVDFDKLQNIEKIVQLITRKVEEERGKVL